MKMHLRRLFVLTLLQAALAAAQAHGDEAAPAAVFDLHDWKLQIPGPKDVKNLRDYSSKYFHLNAAKELCFELDAAEKGTTPGAKYVRSELRHLPNWKASETHSLSAELQVISALQPDKLTVLQIHGITDSGGDAPPLLRIAVNRRDLVAVVQSGNERRQNDTTVLKKNLGDDFVKIEVRVEREQLTISVDGQASFSRSLAFWKFSNYFKAGCYPQATEGTARVMFRKLTAN